MIVELLKEVDGNGDGVIDFQDLFLGLYSLFRAFFSGGLGAVIFYPKP